VTSARAWLETETAESPASLRERMLAAIPASDGPVADVLADAALDCLRAAAADPHGPNAALNLLAADALLTHACAAAAETPDGPRAFTASHDAAFFESVTAS
jgi:hypothetical protein